MASQKQLLSRLYAAIGLDIALRVSPSRPSPIGVQVPAREGTSNAAVERALSKALQQRFGNPDLTAAPIDTAKKIHEFFMDFQFQVRLPGQHYSGMSNQALWDLFVKNGRNFGEDTDYLRLTVRKALVDAFPKGTWNENEAADIAANTIRELIIKRIETQGLDVSLKPLNSAYLRKKVSAGYDPRIGIKRNRWSKSFAKARIIIS